MALLAFDLSAWFDWFVLIPVEDCINPLVICLHLKHNVGKGVNIVTKCSKCHHEWMSVSLPSDWSSFIILEENKSGFALLRSNHLIEESSIRGLTRRSWYSTDFSLHPCSSEHNSCVSVWHRCGFCTSGTLWQNGMYMSRYMKAAWDFESSMSLSTLYSHVAICWSSGHTNCLPCCHWLC